ncbi:GntR family transcriptional regulator [Ramlibacter sp. 2FC]|uniref:GntR family transcriptional regulator n=1 Tax=Ramlibacter sp. 2FC TaxID=2502188 RepID=UPI0010F6DC00|nr:GntR family transcriptional regulator [Ramlibacter sp. 2FC]
MEQSTMRVVRVAAPLRQQVLEKIRAAIAVGQLAPGKRLVERELCEITGVSRTLIREALRQLESEGLVEVIPNKGPIVATISARQAREVFQLRAELEGLASQLFAELATDAQMKALQDAFAQLREAYGSGDSVTMLAAKTRFYDCLVEGSGNETLGNVLRQLHARAMVLRATSLSQPGRTAESERELVEIMKAIRKRDGAAARQASVAHITKAAQAALNVLQARNGEEAAAARPPARKRA